MGLWSIIPLYVVRRVGFMSQKKRREFAEAIADAIVIKALREVLFDRERA